MEALARLVRLFSSRRRTAPEEPVLAPAYEVRFVYTLTLLVRLDERTGRLAPSVQLRGLNPLVRPWIRLELVDLNLRLRHVVTKELEPSAIGTEVALRPFEPPEGATAEEVLGWHWDVVLDDGGVEQARSREHPRPVGRVNAEAELV